MGRAQLSRRLWLEPGVARCRYDGRPGFTSPAELHQCHRHENQARFKPSDSSPVFQLVLKAAELRHYKGIVADTGCGASLYP